ncbi:alpha/beta hydrolase family protein [Hymenobacter saemangeumensis]|uniref:Alpha/beta hydrolase family protein n=1 Tax=Hymenobacter saemangeumensis TaxID=1084522 RepID=A0ABP8I827_9BACT
MRSPFLTCLLLLLFSSWALAQKPYEVLDWKANTTLHSYLMQQLHQQYAPRAGNLEAATQSAPATKAYQDSVRARFRRVLGPLPVRTPLNAQVSGAIERPGFRIEKIIYESMPRHRVTANLYLPAGTGKWPALLFPCGHEAEGKATASYQKTAMLLATHGFAVLVPDPVSQGERMQLTDAGGKALTRGGTTEHTLLNAQATLLGLTLPAAELWDNVRGLDYLSSRPEVDTARLGCLGNSGGATQTAYLLAVDRRLKVAALCSYVAAGERNLELTGPADGCVMLPGAGPARLDLADWLIAFAPKPLLLLAGQYDFVDYTSITTAYREAGNAYAALRQPGPVRLPTISLSTHADGHGISRPKRESVVRWFRFWLRGEEKPTEVKEEDLPLATARELQCTPTGQVSTSFADEESLPAFYQAQAHRLHAARSALASNDIRHAVSQQLGMSLGRLFRPNGHEIWHGTIQTERRDTVPRGGLLFHRLILRGGPGPPLPALRVYGHTSGRSKGRHIACFSDRGKAALADSTAWLRTLLKDYESVLLVDLRGQGETADPAAALDPKYYNREYRPALIGLHLGQPLPAQRVADVATALNALVGNWLDATIDLYADGRSSALVALQAALLTPRIGQVRLRALPASWQSQLAQPTTKDQYSDVLPGVLQHYDVPDLVRALGSRVVK